MLGHVGGARGAELPLAPAQLGLEAAQGPLGEPAVEVADEADGVGERGQAVEGAAALEVDQQEREQLGWRAEGQPGDERAQQLALARAGGAGHEDVGAVAVEVDLDGAPVGPDADRGDGPAAGGPVGIEQVEQADLAGEPDRRAGCLGIIEPGRGAGRGGGDRLGHAGGEELGRLDPTAGRGDPTAAVLVGELDDGGAAGRQPVGAVGDHDAGHGAVVALQQRSGRGVAPQPRCRVDDEEQRDVAGHDQLGRVHEWAGAGVAEGVGEPRAPVPRAGAVVVGHDPEEQVGGPVSGGRLEHQAAGHGQCGIARARDAGDAASSELEGDGRVRQPGGRVHRGGHLGCPAPGVAGNGWRPGDRSRARPERQPVGVGGSPFPEVARRCLDPADRLGRVGQQALEARHLDLARRGQGRGQVGDPTPELLHVAGLASPDPTSLLPRPADDGDRAEEGERAPHEAVQQEDHGDADHGRSQRRDDPDRQGR